MKNEQKKVTRRHYDSEFKEQVLEMHANGRSIRSLAESFGINENLLYKWKRLSKISGVKKYEKESEEVKDLRKQLKEVEQERDILKKALSIFSRHP